MVKYWLLPVFYLLLAVQQGISQNDTVNGVTAFVESDSGKDRIKIENLHLEFKYGGYGVYVISDYPVLTRIPLENGENVDLNSIISASFKGKRVEWKKYIERENRNKYENVDDLGFYHWDELEVECVIKDKQEKIIRSRIKHPVLADIFLTGTTNRGDFRLQLDLENGKIVHVIFVPDFVMQCMKNSTHVFPNAEWIFCPYCGGKLKKIVTVKH
ncbi:MAG TPA: hypothetical protein PLP19_07725 [bacterium]|nr:hypothetical protein [bacterium]HPN43361.1 hypothetical protein [bacterium]